MRRWQELVQFVIYERPKDFPEHFVVRRWTITHGRTAPDLVACLCSTLAEARETVPPDLVCMPRMDDDDAVIVEVWT